MHGIVRSLPPALGALALALALACSEGAEPEATPAPDASVRAAAGTPDADATAGRIGGEPVTVAEVDAWIMEKLFENATGGRNPTRLHEIRTRAFEQMAGERALEAEAARQGLDAETLLHQEVERRSEVSDEEVRAFYEQHRERYGDRSFEQLEASIRQQLTQQKRQRAVAEYLGGLREAAGFELALEPPRFEIPGRGVSRGPDDAPVTLVEFSDYQCPYCRSVEPVVQQVLARYPEQVRLEFRHFPLEQIHPQARTAAIASLCAGDQGRFWEYHRILFERAPKLGEQELKAYADEVEGLDREQFTACMASGKHASTVDADLEAGRAVGVAGTPAFYVNGVAAGGARTVEAFAALIDAELRRLGVPVPEPPPETAAAPAPAAPVVAPAGGAEPDEPDTE